MANNQLIEMVGSTVSGGSLSFISKLGTFDLILWATIIGVCFFVFIRFVTHRKLVNVYQKVKGGYIKTGGRYEITNDKMTNIEYLRPMFGKNRLPNFPAKYWQKIKGIPLLGCYRTINIIKLNSYTYKPVTIDFKMGKVMVDDYDTNGWVYMDEYTKFVRKRRQADIIYIISFVAPSLIIIGTIAFFILAILGQANIEAQAAERMKEITEAMINYGTRTT